MIVSWRDNYLKLFLISLGILCLLTAVRLFQAVIQEEGFDIESARNKEPVDDISPGQQVRKDIKCKSSLVDTLNNRSIWYCDTPNDARKLVAGVATEDNKLKTYLDVYDQVCIAEDKTANPVYTCIDFTTYEYGDDGRWSAKGNYDETCANLGRTYFDLSNNVTNLLKMKGTLEDQQNTYSRSRDNFAGMYKTYSCANRTNMTDRLACDAIQEGSGTFGDETTRMTGLLDKAVPPIISTVDLRGTALSEAKGFACAQPFPAS